MDLDEYNSLKTTAEQKKREADRAKGALDQLMQRLQTEFGCSSLKQARKKLQDMQTQTVELVTEFDTKLKAFEAKWKSTLDS